MIKTCLEKNLSVVQTLIVKGLVIINAGTGAEGI